MTFIPAPGWVRLVAGADEIGSGASLRVAVRLVIHSRTKPDTLRAGRDGGSTSGG
jgi:hypothetical protein